MNNHIKLVIYFSAIFIISSSCSSNKVSKQIAFNECDTIEGFFLYEVNVPMKCYSRFDQIEQGNNFICYDSIKFNENIQDVYQNGVFYFIFQPVIANFMTKTGTRINQDKVSVNTFSLSVDYLNHLEDTDYNNLLYYDRNKILTYKKFFAKFVVQKLGYIKQLIPTTKNYECCYSNKLKSVKSYFVTKVISFEIN